MSQIRWLRPEEFRRMAARGDDHFDWRTVEGWARRAGYRLGLSSVAISLPPGVAAEDVVAEWRLAGSPGLFDGYFSMGVMTGRTSTRGPNLHQVPPGRRVSPRGGRR